MTITKQHLSSLIIALFFSCTAFSQATHTVTDPEKQLKEARDLFNRGEYALAYPLLKTLQQSYPDNHKSDHYYINEDVNYYYIVCELKLRLAIAEADAKHYIDETENEARTELISFHLAHFYFAKEDFNNALRYYGEAGLTNLNNDEIADEQFEKAYSYFNLKRFADAKPLFNEIHQLPGNKYYIPANYYYGFICYYNGDYEEALTSFRMVADKADYKTIVPYYIDEILYFQGKKDEAIAYGEKALASGDLFYEKEVKLLLGQIYFEKKDFHHALPLMEYYINNSDKVRKEDFYELSYCYFQTGNIKKAAQGFKQLSAEKDTLGQNSMYLLADCYLRLDQKEDARTAFQYCANSDNNTPQKEIAAFNYAKLSYELGYQDIALDEMKKFITNYPKSVYTPEAKEMLVSLLANTNNFSEALTLYQSIDHPTASEQKVYPRILYGKAMEYINDQQVIHADTLLNMVIAAPISSVTAYAYFWKGEIAYRLGNNDSAIFYMGQYIADKAPSQGDANPTNAKYDLGYSWMKKGGYNIAVPSFEAIGQNTRTASSIQQDAYIRAADCYYMMRNFAKANTMYEAVVANSLSQSDYALFQKAMIAGVKSPANKIALLNELTVQYSNSSLVPDATMEIALTYIADEKFHDALPYLNKVIASTNDEGLKPQAYVKSGLCYYNLNDDSDALANYILLVQKYPSSSEADDALGTIKSIYVEENKPDAYIALMQASGKAVSPVEADQLTYNAAAMKYSNGDYDAALTAFTNYIAKYPTGTYVLDAHYNMAECYAKGKDWADAIAGYDYVNKQGINKYFEKATLSAASISYFELQQYDTAEHYFEALREAAVNQDNQLEALRGLVRCYYQLKDYTKANTAAQDLLTRKGINTDDRSIALLVLGKSQEADSDFVAATISFKACAAINKSAWGAEARYEIAWCQYALANYTAAQKAAKMVIKETGSYDYWVTSSYILLGDLFMQQKDYFNAKATYGSVASNAVIPELKNKAQQKLDTAVAEEKANSKIN